MKKILGYSVIAFAIGSQFTTAINADENYLYEELSPINEEGLLPLNDDQTEVYNAIVSQSMRICKNQRVPKGWVITGEASGASCSGRFPNMWIIKKPSTSDSICKISPFPDGYVITAESSSASCPHQFPNVWKIKTPRNTDTMCSISPLPEGYVITGRGSSASCPGRFPNTTKIKKL